jgi:hypothetical protein
VSFDSRRRKKPGEGVETATEVFSAVFLAVIGLSHAIQPRAWVEFFIWLRGKGHAGVFVNGFLSLSFGSFIVAFHNVWNGLPVILTVLGWTQVLKGLVNFVAPQVALWGLNRVSYERAWHFIVAGMFALGLSAVLWYSVLTR